MVKRRTVDYRIPGHNRVTLSDELAEEIRERFAIDRENRFQLCLLASGLRRRYLNKKTGEYVAEFQDWYKKQRLVNLFGTLPNFTKYAAAGDVVAYVASKTSNPDKYLKRLPVSVGTLYEISQILKDDKDVFKLCLQFTARRKSLGAPKHEWVTRYPSLINPKATEAIVRNWRRQWNDPPPPRTKRTDKRTLPLATITVSGELFDFDRKTGDKTGCADLSDVEAFFHKINELFNDENAIQFKLDDSMDYLTDGYYRWKNKSDPAANILHPKPKTNSAKKSKKRS